MMFGWLVVGQVVRQTRRWPYADRSTCSRPGDAVLEVANGASSSTRYRRYPARSAGPRNDRHPHLFFRADRRGAQHEDRRFTAARRWLDGPLHEKGGKQHAVPCHHALAEALHAYIEVAGIAEDRKGCLFRTAVATAATICLSSRWNNPPLADDPPARQGGRHHRGDRQSHFRATGITAYLANGGALEHAQEMAAHEALARPSYTAVRGAVTQDEVRNRLWNNRKHRLLKSDGSTYAGNVRVDVEKGGKALPALSL